MNVERYWINLTGRVTACATHDLNNVLATIRESAGLIKDCMETGNSFEGKAGRMAGSSLNVIQSQVGSGITLVNAVNRFAHISDTDQGHSGNLSDVAGHAVFLMTGLAKRQGLSLTLAGSEENAGVSGDQFLVNIVVFLMIDLVMECCEQGDSIDVSVSEGGERSVLFVDRKNGPVRIPESSEKLDLLKKTIESVGGHMGKDLATKGVQGFFAK